MNKRKKVLIAPLDWGLGHATRCIKVIDFLLEEGADVIIGADGRPFELLRKEFPTLQIIRFPGIQIEYDQDGNLAYKMFIQLYSYLRGLWKEHRKLKQLIKDYKIEIVISDSRGGVFSQDVPSILILHQIRILLPKYLKWGESFLASIIRIFINRFSECWIPDYDGTGNLAGSLTHGAKFLNNAHFIGPLSRFRPIVRLNKINDILIILSGPEPQRTQLEELLISQLKNTKLKTFVVRGITEKNITMKLADTLQLVSSLNTEALIQAIAHSDIVISRSGYSTIMDFSVAGINAIFIPTPGQTEQEYLAEYIKEKNICFSMTQEKFDINIALEESKKYHGFPGEEPDYSMLKSRILHHLNN